MANGYWEKLLEVDMTTGKVEITNRHMQYADEYIGGHAMAAKMLWEALKDNPGADPMGPENPLMLFPGITAGTGFPGIASRYIAYTKSGITQAKNPLYGESSATVGYATSGGKFAAKLKWAGFDGIYVTGVSETPKYLYINNGTAELLDASEYWGMRCSEFEEAMQNKYDTEHSIISVGPAAENGVRYSCIESETGRAAGRSGCGAVMGGKKLKGVVVFGDMPLPMATIEGYKDMVEEMQQAVLSHAQIGLRQAFGSGMGLTRNSMAGTESTRNHAEGTNPNDDKIGTAVVAHDFWVRHRSCWACPVYCMKAGVVKEGPYQGTIAEGPEYESAMNGANWLIDDMGEFGKIMEVVEEAGFDLIGVGGVVGFALECYEKKIITSDMIEGIKLEWSNGEEILKFLDKLLYGKGEIWDWLRRGSSYAARKIDAKYGTNAIRYAVDVKNHSFAAHGVQGQANFGMATTYSFCNRGACHVNGSSIAAQNSMVFMNMGVSCQRGGNTLLGSTNILKCINYVTGRNLSMEEIVAKGEKVFNLERTFNVCNGFRFEDDDLPDRVFEDALTIGPKAGSFLDREAWNKARAAYIEGRGWDAKTAFPTEGKLQELGLDDVIPYLRKAADAMK